MMRILLIALLLMPCLLASADNQQLEVADYLDFEQVADPQISPDGEQVVFTRRWVDQQIDRWSSALWLMDSDGDRQRYLTQGSHARWSPQGDRILYLAKDANGQTQIFVRWLADGATSQVTRGQIKPSSPLWSPDGKSIAFVAVVPQKEDWKISLPSAPEGAEWTKAPRVLDDLHYRQDRVGYMEAGYSHLFVVPASAGSARQLTDGNWNVGARRTPEGFFSGAGLSWSPDGQSIVFDGFKSASTVLTYRRSDIFSIAVATGEITQLTEQPGYWSEPLVSPNGKVIAFEGHPASDETYVMNRLYTMSADGGAATLVSDEFDQPISGDKWWAGDSSSLLFSALDAGYVHIYRMSLDGKLVALTDGERVARLSSIADGGDIGVGIISDFSSPFDIYAFDLDGRPGEQRLTAVNDDLLLGKSLARQEEIWFEAEDGNRAHGWVLYPPDYDETKNYPMIMEIHGGPFSMYQGRFSLFYQIYAANGYVVLYTNPRGSTGYGEAFSQAINFAYPSVDYLDLMAGVDAVLEQSAIDPNRLYVGGCSGGGVLTSWVIGHTDRFAAASVRCPVINWMSMLGQTDVPNFTQSFFKKPFWEDPADWLRHSPIMYVGNVKTPTIVMTGEQDLRTPMAQSEEYYAALKMAGVPAKLLRFNDQYHGTSTHPSNAMRTMLYLMSWYEQYDLDGARDTGSDGDDVSD